MRLVCKSSKEASEKEVQVFRKGFVPFSVKKRGETVRVFLIVLDSFGIGHAPDAREFGDEGANTLLSISNSPFFKVSNLCELGLGRIETVQCCGEIEAKGSFGRAKELSLGKDTTIGHWEMAGVVSKTPMPTYPNGFPEELIKRFEEKTGRKTLCNRPISGTKAIEEYGKEQVDTGALIVYTSADSVFQIAAHEGVVALEQLYEYCKIARELLVNEHSVGRVIARPFIGVEGHYKRTANRHDFSLLPPQKTMLNYLQENGHKTYGVGKIKDIFAGSGIDYSQSIQSNEEGMKRTIELLEEEFEGLCFTNLVDFDMLYGHRNDIDGYAKAMTEFDEQLATFLQGMRATDMLIITADHGCDPGHEGTDHTRECVPILVYGERIKAGINLGTRDTYADIAATVLEYFKVKGNTEGTSFYKEIRK